MFLVETWLIEARLVGVLRKLKQKNNHYMWSDNRGGDLMLHWREDVDMIVVGSSLNHINALINDGQDNSWRFSSFYGTPEMHKHQESWDLLRSLNRNFALPWLCVGDFNEILKSHEKGGGRLRPFKQMQDFRAVVDECGLIDLGFLGNKFTWWK